MKKTTLFLIAGLSLLAVRAQTPPATPNFTAEKNGIKVNGYDNPKTFLDAKLELTDPPAGKDMMDTGKTVFKFKVDNYELGIQTPDAGQQMCANSAKGQHIHFILDNQPYQASYTPDVPTSLKPGHHVLLAFLSRSYHESIKTQTAYILREFNSGKKSPDQFDAKAPHIFFSRPKGEYIGPKETHMLLLDFYLINCTLSEKGYKVRATINGTAFILTKWEPYFIQGLPLGDNKVKLELLDKNDMPVASEYNGTERTIKLTEEPAAK